MQTNTDVFGELGPKQHWVFKNLCQTMDIFRELLLESKDCFCIKCTKQAGFIPLTDWDNSPPCLF